MSSTAAIGPAGRRPRPLLVAALGVAVAALALVWTRYDPLVAGGPTSCPPGAATAPLDDAGPERVCGLSNRDAGAFSFGVSVRNDGLVAVRVADVALRGEIEGVVTVDGPVMSPAPGGRTPAVVPFETFRLPPGDERLVGVSVSLPACAEARRARVVTFTHLPLRTRLFGVPRDTRVPLDPAVRLIVERC